MLFYSGDTIVCVCVCVCVLPLVVSVCLEQQVSDLLRWVQTMKLCSVPSLQPADTWEERDDMINDSVLCVILFLHHFNFPKKQLQCCFLNQYLNI